MKILVTGAAGFIGSVLCARLSERGIDTIAVDNGSRGLNDVSRLPHVTYRQQDYRAAFEDVARGSVETVFHLAAKTGSLSYPLETLLEENARAAVDFYRQAAAHGVKVFVFPTTSLALGVPDSPYVVSKEAAVVQLLAAYEARADAPLPLLCRFFNVSGGYRGYTERRKDEVHLLPTLWQCYRDRQPFVINGSDYDTLDGTPSRDFIHVLDLVDFLLYRTQRLLAGDDHDPTSIVPIGRGQPVTVLELLEIGERLGYKIESTYGPRRPFDCGELRCPEDAVRALTAWRPLRSIDDIIRDEWHALNVADVAATRIGPTVQMRCGHVIPGVLYEP